MLSFHISNKTNFCVGVAGYPEKHMEAPSLKSDLHFIWEKQYECIQKYDIEKNMEHYVLLYSNN